MTPSEIESALIEAFSHCDASGIPLCYEQKQILLQVALASKESPKDGFDDNPLYELSQEELQALLSFIKSKEAQNISWKALLLNDWLNGQDSGEVHFLRQRYGVQWLNRLQPHHFESLEVTQAPKLKVGDSIEVCNALWEWVQDSGPCQREWFNCTVIYVDETINLEDTSNGCIIRFENGAEYHISGIYDWNRYNWRWNRGGL
ncbi:hypothetical protein DSM106972_031600 [Dulcicalothrix desertica PCC 7102]|uniref:Uncharacterized protein n=1 Tax=Dulcicalothrix desertica PCC 7102 TaxID=232991 RepID=A0A433VIL2_9CYAN|nr:hypothetical protein [Dulcicalothrix desertica]RUT05954.1 hypothetical protein DSM106972_031600 [Dulcicalothrix desertica PCC 7102]TWH54371.1 hypothetical protein CAL7102_02397 [Dulcicalothrix desertica PCC 7102]